MKVMGFVFPMMLFLTYLFIIILDYMGFCICWKQMDKGTDVS